MPAVPVLLLCVKPANQSVALPMNIKIYSPQTRACSQVCVRGVYLGLILCKSPLYTLGYSHKLAITVLKEISAERNSSLWVVENVFENIFFKEWKSLTVFEHQMPNKEVGPPFGGVSVPRGVLPYKFWTVSNWMFTLH